MGDGQLDHNIMILANSRGMDSLWVVYDYRGHSWLGLQGNIGREVSERKDFVVAQITDRYIIGTK